MTVWVGVDGSVMHYFYGVCSGHSAYMIGLHFQLFSLSNKLCYNLVSAVSNVNALRTESQTGIIWRRANGLQLVVATNDFLLLFLSAFEHRLDSTAPLEEWIRFLCILNVKVLKIACSRFCTTASSVEKDYKNFGTKYVKT